MAGPPLRDPPVAVALLRPFTVSLGQISRVSKVLATRDPQLFRGGSAHVRVLVHQRVDEPLDAMPAAVVLPPLEPGWLLDTQVLDGDANERLVRGRPCPFVHLRKCPNQIGNDRRLERLSHRAHGRSAVAPNARGTEPNKSIANRATKPHG